MEGTRIISERIKQEAQKQGVKVKDILSYYEIDRNLVNKLANGKDTGTQNICKIADYLKCSTDYLFGRSDEPRTTYQSIQLSNIVNGNNGNNSPLTVSSQELDESSKELIELVKKLPIVERAKAIIYLNELKTKTSPDSGEE